MKNNANSKNGKTKKKPEVQFSSGNVFADLGLPNPELMLAKAELVRRIRNAITERKLTQAKAAILLGIDQPKVSGLIRGQVRSTTLDRLFKFLNLLGYPVEIKILKAVDLKTAKTTVSMLA